MSKFLLNKIYPPRGDQTKAIKQLIAGFDKYQAQTLLGVTGSGKTFTVANIINQTQKPTLVLSHNKTLAAQLYQEFQTFFPQNKVFYFVSYYDYYQPESYLPPSDTYIEKDSSVNERIEQLRLEAATALLSRQDVIIVSSVSCIYGFGQPEDFKGISFEIKAGQKIDRQEFLESLISLQYQRNDVEFLPGRFRAKGDTIDIFPRSSIDRALRIEIFNDQVEKISEIHPVTLRQTESLKQVWIYPAKPFIVPAQRIPAPQMQISLQKMRLFPELLGFILKSKNRCTTTH